MSRKHYRVRLDASQRDYLMALISSGRESARKLTRARVLLRVSDASELGPAYTDEAIKAAVEVSLSTLERVVKSSCLKGSGLPWSRNLDA